MGKDHRISDNGVLRREYLDVRGRKWQGAEVVCVMRIFITCTFHEMLLG